MTETKAFDFVWIATMKDVIRDLVTEKKRREKINITKLSRQFGYEANWLSKVMSGDKAIGLKELTILSTMLGLSEADLIQQAKKAPSPP
jgi:cyanate lyase